MDIAPGREKAKEFNRVLIHRENIEEKEGLGPNKPKKPIEVSKIKNKSTKMLRNLVFHKSFILTPNLVLHVLMCS